MIDGERAALQAVSADIERDRIGPLYLVAGDRVLAEPAAVAIGSALAARAGCEVEVFKRPAELAPLLSDLRTYSLFGTGKVLVAIDTAALADAGAAADLIDEALEACPTGWAEGGELSERERRSACRLLQTLRLFRLDTESGSASELIGQLPEWVLRGGKGSGRRRRRGSRQVAEARKDLSDLLEVARAAGLHGWAETELNQLADIAERGLPPGHSLVLAESVVAEPHPVVEVLAAQGRFVKVGEVEAARGGGWKGIDLLAEELHRETGVGISTEALEELARRTIRRQESRRPGAEAVAAESTARFAAEYRKLSMMATGGEIRSELVENVVEDRGEEDAWKTLDAIGAGRADEALVRIRRLLAAAADPISARLSFFALLAGFARQLTVLSDRIESLGLPREPMRYPSFKSRVAPRLQAELPDGHKNPLAGVHPYRLFRAYSVACRMSADALWTLPAKVLETERRLKGDSGLPDVALTALVCDLATAVRRSR